LASRANSCDKILPRKSGRTQAAPQLITTPSIIRATGVVTSVGWPSLRP